MNGIKIRLETKPGRSRASAGVLPRSVASAEIALAVSSEVSSPRITSTSFSTGTGLKKCMPITRSGRDVAARPRDRDRRGVGGEHRRGGQHLVGTPEDVAFHAVVEDAGVKRDIFRRADE